MEREIVGHRSVKRKSIGTSRFQQFDFHYSVINDVKWIYSERGIRASFIEIDFPDCIRIK